MSVVEWAVGAFVVGVAGKVLLGLGKAASAPPMTPRFITKDFGVPFAPPTGRVWPVLRSSQSGIPISGDKSVPFTTPSGAVNGNSATAFHASREGGLRFHAGIDLQAAPGQRIVAMEDGVVLGLIPGFVGLQTVVIQHPAVVAVYAELRWDTSLPSPGMRVKAGDVIALGALNKDGNSMLHLELWQTGFAPKAYTPWFQKNPPPAGLLDPTRYLLNLSLR